jgi:hypothetical protein
MIYSNNTGSISYEESYWDARVLGCNTLDIKKIDADIDENYYKLIESFKISIENKYKFVSFRMESEDETLKKALIENGFYLVEKSYCVIGKNINVEKLKPISSSCFLTTHLSSKDLINIKNIGELDFHFGRFFEDPFIVKSLAQRRNSFWINDIINSEEVKIVGLKNKNITVGFMAFQEGEDNIQLLIGGVNSTFAHLAYGFWSNFIIEYCGQKTIRTTISCSNIPIVNLYSYLGFRFDKVLTGFHLHL